LPIAQLLNMSGTNIFSEATLKVGKSPRRTMAALTQQDMRYGVLAQ
jgi:hypothetical protein